MSETLLITILSGLFALISSLVSYWFGRRSERHKQSLAIRSEMLKPIEEWLQGAEKILAIFGDTVMTVNEASPTPLLYDFSERRKAVQLISEKSNIVWGILQSKSLQTRNSTKYIKELSSTIETINGLIINRVLPMESELVGRKALTTSLIEQIATSKMMLDKLIQEAYSLIAQIKTVFT